jgi:hypothetical protein
MTGSSAVTSPDVPVLLDGARARVSVGNNQGNLGCISFTARTTPAGSTRGSDVNINFMTPEILESLRGEHALHVSTIDQTTKELTAIAAQLNALTNEVLQPPMDRITTIIDHRKKLASALENLTARQQFLQSIQDVALKQDFILRQRFGDAILKTPLISQSPASVDGSPTGVARLQSRSLDNADNACRAASQQSSIKPTATTTKTNNNVTGSRLNTKAEGSIEARTRALEELHAFLCIKHQTDFAKSKMPANIPKFDKTCTAIRAFLEHYSAFAATHMRPHQYQLGLIEAFQDSLVTDTIITSVKANEDFATTANRVMRLFASSLEAQEAKLDFENATQGDNETVGELARRMRDLAEVAGIEVDTIEACTYYKSALNSNNLKNAAEYTLLIVQAVAEQTGTPPMYSFTHLALRVQDTEASIRINRKKESNHATIHLDEFEGDNEYDDNSIFDEDESQFDNNEYDDNCTFDEDDSQFDDEEPSNISFNKELPDETIDYMRSGHKEEE